MCLHDVRFTPKSAHQAAGVECPLCANNGMDAPQQAPPLFNHLVRPGEQRGRHIEAERLGRLEVDDISYLVGACTGRSAGFSPFKMRST